MFLEKSSYQKLKKKYLKYIKSQEALSEPFRDKIDQLNNFYLPITKMIKETYSKEKKNTNYRLNWCARIRKINHLKYFKNNFTRKLQFRNSYIFN